IYKRFQYLKKAFQSNNNRTLDKELMLDIQLSSLYKSYLTFHLYGSIKWWEFQNKLSWLRKNKIAADWVTHNPNYDIAELMLHYPLSKIVQATTPSSFGYNRMLNELKRLKRVKSQGGWKKIPNSSQLQYGKSGSHVKQLINRLRSSGDYTCAPSNGDNHFGPCLQKAVKRFQKRHGLYPSGKMNSYTRKKMNISVDWKIKKVLLNLDRIKRLPDQPEDRYYMVNIPDFRLYYKENGREKLSMRVIVGDKENHTPIFSDKISFIVLNPYWIMPDSIVKNEMIPSILKNPNFLTERGYEVRTSYNTKRAPIDASRVDWAKILRTGQSKRYKFMQPPGPKNALGKIKFKFPNQFAVYLHDTPNKKLFKKGQRAFSHGCIRVAEPNRLLSTFAPHERSVNYNRAQSILRGKNKTQLNLAKPVPVHIVYLTAWINSDGLLHYRNDIYNYDTKQRRAIQ
ncbi:MAG: L,D-transpeptidase family protein, partial [Epsilonproteobacteria bacterium]|nr:L,D-transpeptidase family protein [Campylobacterota bacterium]